MNMNLLETLKQFKAIHPDPSFSEKSKRAILATEPVTRAMPAVRPWNLRRTLLGIFETGTAVALTGFFILLITGAFSGTEIAPVQYSAIDPQSLRAEAQAIDMQIKLANLTYVGSSAQSTASVAPANNMPTAAATSTAAPPETGTSTQESSAAASSSTSTSTPTTTLSLDAALQSLSK